jgi:hypothetical protein
MGLFMFISIVLWLNYSMVFTIVVYAALVFLLLSTEYAYIRIFIVGRQKLGHSGNRPGAAEQTQAGLNKKRSFVRELKLAKSCFLVFICYLICFIPGPLIYFIEPENDTHIIRRVKRNWILTLFALNSSLNSLIFFWAKPMLKKEAIKVLKRLCHQHANDF